MSKFKHVERMAEITLDKDKIKLRREEARRIANDKTKGVELDSKKEMADHNARLRHQAKVNTHRLKDQLKEKKKQEAKERMEEASRNLTRQNHRVNGGSFEPPPSTPYEMVSRESVLVIFLFFF